MAGGVLNGQSVNQTVTNAAFLFANGDSFTIGILGLQNNVDPNSGYFVASVQRYLNNIAQTIGLAYNANYTAEADSTGRVFNSTSGVVPNGTTYKTAITSLSNKFSGSVTGGSHSHAGTDGDGAPIAFTTLLGVRSGSAQAITGSDELTINFNSFDDINFAFVPVMRNEVDSDPIFLQWYVKEKTTSSVKLKFNTYPDSMNYYFDYTATENF